MTSRYSLNKNKKKPYILWGSVSVITLLAAAAALWIYMNDWDLERSMERITESVSPASGDSSEEAETLPSADAVEEPPLDLPIPEEPIPEEVVDATQYPEEFDYPEEPLYIDGILLVNKQNPLPKDYAPGESPEARAAVEEMRRDALEEGIELVAFSTYRSFDRQKVLYEGYVAKDGQKAADRYSARPGFSEHQTGLAFDFGEAGKEEHWASVSFGETAGGEWLKENAHRYGFILRYPEGTEEITGYMHESWHYRYVGVEPATEIHEQQTTLEEYLKAMNPE
jgi:zinc D-Ala-D-Ala carboxypeptidase